ncbi:MAG: hypothetical protein R3B60_03435 [Candidatus Paceibacterota bacterium]
MEGTRHERVAIIVTSYVIGFVTGFILLTDSSPNTEHLYVSSPTTVNKLNHSQKMSIPSNDEKFVFLCEEMQGSIGNCTAYIYDVDSSAKRQALLDGNTLTMENEIASFVKWSDTGLAIGSTIQSVDPNTPWFLTTRNAD